MDYREEAKGIHALKGLGQNFLVNKGVAKTEANFGIGKNVIELGPGMGILTEELCRSAKRVLAIEKDTRLYGYLKEKLKQRKNLELRNEDFFDSEIDSAGFDIMIANIPYNLSSKVIYWLAINAMPAVLCLQKEFVDHLLARPSERSYSRLSVITTLEFTVTSVVDVPPQDFYPKPKVASSVVLMRPRKELLSRAEVSMISLIMNHKKKRTANALMDSSKSLGIPKDKLKAVIAELPDKDVRPFQMEPAKLLSVARFMIERTSSK